MTDGVRLRPRRRLAIALFLSTSLSTFAVVQPAAAQSQSDAWETFFQSGYTYCDAKLVGALWGMSPEEGKIEIGMKVINGLTANLRGVLGESRANGNRCGWEDTGLDYSDAGVLANIWGLTTSNAKLKAARHMTNGRQDIIQNALGY